MSELTLTLLRLGYLVLLWLFVLSVVAVLRRDLFGSRASRRAPVTAGAGAAMASQRTAPAESRFEPRTLLVTEGPLKGTTIALGQAPIMIGRAPESTLVLDDDFASGRHARLSLQQGTWMVEDLGSTNGTFLGRNRVQDPVPIAPGAHIRIGRTVLELRR
jgi:pSer/pThr/pTyr-binding forkhead associated (FHA) protein